MKRQRLSRQSWIDAGLLALISDGPGALAAEPLARVLGTTKGSFYWHFKDVPAFQTAVSNYWQSVAFAQVVDALAKEGNPEQRLRRFGKDILKSKQDPAMRAWGQTDRAVAMVIAQVDAERLTYLTTLLDHLGVRNDDFARSCLAALVGLPIVANKTVAAKSYETLIDLIVALK